MADQKTKKVIALICCRDDHSLNPQLLSSLKTQTFPIEYRFIKDPASPQRVPAVSHAPNYDAYLFLDADVYLPAPDYIEKALQVFEKRPDLNWLGGLYLSSRSASYLTKSYNFLVNHWILASRITMQANEPNQVHNLAGGIWLIKEIPSDWFQWETHFWGGEDTWILRKAAESGEKFFLSEKLSVIHSPQFSIKSFFRRAWLHGKNRHHLDLNTPKKKIQISKDFFYYLPFLLAHQIVVESACLCQRISKRILHVRG